MKLLALSGGRHPYHESTPILGDFLQATGHEMTITEDAADVWGGQGVCVVARA
jgi:hypothetical protein